MGVALLFVGCAGAESSTRRDTFHQRAGLPGERWSASGEDSEREQEAEEADAPSRQPLYRRHMFRESVSLGAGQRQQDAFDVLLQSAGLEERDTRPVAGSSLSPTHAARLLKTLLKRDVTLGQFPSRVAVGFVLREVLATGEVSRAELVRRVARFRHLAVLRPDGCLAWVISGRTQQRVAPVEWKDGAFRAHAFELGRFYDGRTGVFRLLNDELREENGFALADVHDDADVISRTLDGAEEAFVGLALAVGKFFSTSPADNLAALRQMPAAVVALLESSPEYLERFRYMTRGEQVQAVSRLVTNLVATWGTVSAATRTLGGTGFATAEVPALVLSADGTVAMRLVSSSTGRAAGVLSGGPGAAIILQRASTAAKSGAPSKGPGQWAPANEKMSPRARRYQEQISRHSADEAYWVGGTTTKNGGVKFDGFEKGVLLEAKGPGYAKFFEGLDPKSWFKNSGAKSLVEQAQRQLRAVRATNTPVRWHVAEESAADAIRNLLERYEDAAGIEVVFTPPVM
ncbi:restriction endonuclease fold toxin 5 domain-containing protein [Myxococcus sp. MISCRS1]|uniref:restriction endonuclease fold toxin 5 domain-containing protein n=1 Tax=Myxococcus sp. MISCRS1 TaxID=2996786 RepID=UPI00226F11E6|nr:restriction endonuclease fold toxin 5 domain-containing protein [Myxococcus sp. MISCRS1]MCY0997952.1 restriction endonuclease fold toxin 5 domain-containing protein [Myxococcus sp. MISCRS1]